MPWTGQEFASRHNKKLKGAAASKAAGQASAMVRAGVPEGIAIATANKHANHGLDSVKRYADGGKVSSQVPTGGDMSKERMDAMKPMTSKDMDTANVPRGTGMIRNERTGKVTHIGNDAPMGGDQDKDRKETMPKFAKGGKVNIHGMPIHEPMSMHQMKGMR